LNVGLNAGAFKLNNDLDVSIITLLYESIYYFASSTFSSFFISTIFYCNWIPLICSYKL